jgi:ATP-binding cassette subfamily B protein
MLADRVALLESGRITAVGKHSDLLASSDHYRFVISSLEDEEAREAVERSRQEANRTNSVPVQSGEEEEVAR